MITKWIFLESARKNVQDEISRPLRSREIHKKSVYSFAGHPVFVGFPVINKKWGQIKYLKPSARSEQILK